MAAVDEAHGAASERGPLIIGERIALRTIGTGCHHAFRGRCLGIGAGLLGSAHGVMLAIIPFRRMNRNLRKKRQSWPAGL